MAPPKKPRTPAGKTCTFCGVSNVLEPDLIEFQGEWICPDCLAEQETMLKSAMENIALLRGEASRKTAARTGARAARTLALAADFDRLLSTLLIGNNIVNNVATTIGAVLFIKLIGSAKGPTVSATVLTVVILVFGEVTPKSLATVPESMLILIHGSAPSISHKRRNSSVPKL